MSELDEYLAHFDEKSPEGQRLRDPVRMLRELRAAEDMIASNTRLLHEIMTEADEVIRQLQGIIDASDNPNGRSPVAGSRPPSP